MSTRSIQLDKIDPSFNERSESAPPRLIHKHDNLHMAKGLENCWCFCSLCWRYLMWNNILVGYCICRECPCNKPF